MVRLLRTSKGSPSSPASTRLLGPATLAQKNRSQGATETDSAAVLAHVVAPARRALSFGRSCATIARFFFRS